MKKKLYNRFFCTHKTLKSKECSYDLSGNVNCNDCIHNNNCDKCIHKNSSVIVCMCQGCTNRDNEAGNSAR